MLTLSRSCGQVWQYGPLGMLSTPLVVFDNMCSTDDAPSVTCLDVTRDGSLALAGSPSGTKFPDKPTNSIRMRIPYPDTLSCVSWSG
jgi:hypothetical protein